MCDTAGQVKLTQFNPPRYKQKTLKQEKHTRGHKLKSLGDRESFITLCTPCYVLKSHFLVNLLPSIFHLPRVGLSITRMFAHLISLIKATSDVVPGRGWLNFYLCITHSHIWCGTWPTLAELLLVYHTWHNLVFTARHLQGLN